MFKKAELILFDNNLHVYEFGDHKDEKPKYSKLVEDIANTNMNVNDKHHHLVYQSPTGIQLNNAFHLLVESPEIKEFCQEKTHDIMPSSDSVFAITDMWLTIVPPNGSINFHNHNGLFHGMYFLHCRDNESTLVFNSGVENRYYESIGNPSPNRFNSRLQSINIIEGHIYFIPSHIEHNTTSNSSDDTRISINFNIDLIER